MGKSQGSRGLFSVVLRNDCSWDSGGGARGKRSDGLDC